MKERIVEILQAANREWVFDDMKIKVSPHTPPVEVRMIWKQDDEWIVNWVSLYNHADIKLVEINHPEVLATIYQRLKFLTLCK
jgi:hypothetical protein